MSKATTTDSPPPEEQSAEDSRAYYRAIIAPHLNALIDKLDMPPEKAAARAKFEKKLDNAIENLIDRILFLQKPLLDERSPLFNYDEKTARAAEILGISQADFILAALIRPELFGQSPKTLNANIEGAVRLFWFPDLSDDQFEKFKTGEEFRDAKAHYIEKAALKNPQLFYQSPETLNANIEGAVRLLWFPQISDDQFETFKTSKTFRAQKTAYIEQAALKQPPLFCSSPKTIALNFQFIKAAHKTKLITSDDIMESILECPIVLTLSTKNTTLRIVHARQNNFSSGISHFYKGTGRNKTQIQTKVLEHLEQEFNSASANTSNRAKNQVLSMRKHGIISKIPNWHPAAEAA